MSVLSKIIGIPLGYLMFICMALVGNYGLAIILFTLLTKVILFPLNIWVQKNSVKMIRIKPMLNEVEARYICDKNRVSEEQLKLYKQENYKPLLGVIPMLIQIPMILGLISVIYNPLTHLLHLNPEVISAFTQKVMEIMNVSELGSSAQINVIALVTDARYTGIFAALPISGAAEAVTAIQSLNLNFLGLDLSVTPSLTTFNWYLLIPIISGLSAFLLSWSQNLVNVLQKEASWMGRWGMAIFLTAFSTYFAFLVPVGVGVYWIAGNVLAIVVMLVVNWIIPPKKYIDYPALEKSKERLAQARVFERTQMPTSAQKAQAKNDYNRFCDEKTLKEVVFYAEKNGFYKYFKHVINALIKNSDITVHYVTSDPNDAVFKMDEPQIVPYYIDDNRLIVAFMKADCDIMVMTTPDLQQFHLKRSLVRKDVEYIYMFHGPLSTNMVVRKGAYDYYDTVFCVGQHQIDELRETESMYPELKLPKKNLLPVGFGLLEELIQKYSDMPARESNAAPRILIAPSYQDDNIMDSCIDRMLEMLLPTGYTVILRPHPQYMRHNASAVEALKAKYADALKANLIIEDDFATNSSIYTSDLLITDWSGIAYEFAFATKKPALFINTPMKVLNPDYVRYEHQPLDITLRDKVGISHAPNKLDGLTDAVNELLNNPDKYSARISQILSECVFNLGKSGEVGAEYIIGQVNKNREKRKSSGLN